MSVSRVLFLARDLPEPSGGRRFLYQQVDLLNANGVDAWAVHESPRFRYTWFENNTRVGHAALRRSIGWKSRARSWISTPKTGARSPRIQPKPSDVVVVPETCGPAMDRIAPGVPKVVLNQSPFLTHRSMGWSGPSLADRYRVAEVRAIIVLSDTNRAYQQYMFTGFPLFQMRLAINEALFHRGEPKRPQIAFMPRRGKRDAEMLIGMLRNRGLLDGFNVIPIEGMSEVRVAEILRESLIFLAFSSREGFGLPAAEAMACGCIVVGYTGQGGDEFFDRNYAFPIADGDLLEFSSAMEHILSLYREDPVLLDTMGRKASNKILEKYDRLKAEAECLKQWQALLRECFGAPQTS